MKKLLLMTAATAFAAAPFVHAQLPVSRTTSIVSVPSTAGQVQLLSIPVHREPVHRSIVSAVSGSTVTLADPLEATLSGAHVAMIVTGTHRGKWFNIDTAVSTISELTLVSFPGGVTLTTGLDQLEIIPNWTLGTLFANSNAVPGFLDGFASNCFINVGGSNIGYWLRNTTPAQWQTIGTNTPSDNVVVPFGASIRFTQRSVNNVVFSGVRFSGRQALPAPVQGAVSWVSLPYYRNYTSGELKNLIAGSFLEGLADQLIINTGGSNIAYYKNNSNQLIRITAPSGGVLDDSTVIPAGSGIGIVRRQGTIAERFVPIIEPFTP